MLPRQQYFYKVGVKLKMVSNYLFLNIIDRTTSISRYFIMFAFSIQTKNRALWIFGELNTELELMA